MSIPLVLGGKGGLEKVGEGRRTGGDFLYCYRYIFSEIGETWLLLVSGCVYLSKAGLSEFGKNN